MTKKPKTHPLTRKELLGWLWKNHGFSGDVLRAGPKYVLRLHDANGKAYWCGTNIRDLPSRSFEEWMEEINFPSCGM